jgi:hypothetical protein
LLGDKAGGCRHKTGRPSQIGAMGVPKRHGDLDRKCEQGAPRTKPYV